MWHELSDTVLVSSLEISVLVKSVDHDLVAYIKLDFFASMLVHMVSLVYFHLEEIIVSLSHVVGESFNDLGSIQCGF